MASQSANDGQAVRDLIQRYNLLMAPKDVDGIMQLCLAEMDYSPLDQDSMRKAIGSRLNQKGPVRMEIGDIGCNPCLGQRAYRGGRDVGFQPGRGVQAF
ncbi:MAG: hypothetical protein QHH07_03270 [Sedimentisphaerales bacterium]|nr:hypothetical protein [Sedimentisphaerales bacterium]